MSMKQFVFKPVEKIITIVPSFDHLNRIDTEEWDTFMQDLGERIAWKYTDYKVIIRYPSDHTAPTKVMVSHDYSNEDEKISDYYNKVLTRYSRPVWAG